MSIKFLSVLTDPKSTTSPYLRCCPNYGHDLPAVPHPCPLSLSHLSCTDACGTLVAQPGIEPGPLAVNAANSSPLDHQGRPVSVLSDLPPCSNQSDLVKKQV